MAGTAVPQQYVEADAPTATPTPGATTTLQGPPAKKFKGADVIPFVPEPPPRGDPKAGKGAGKTRANDCSVHDGRKYLKNRAGHGLCRGFQAGTCSRLNTWSLCSADGWSAHQCEYCLQVGHGSGDTRKCPMQRGGGGNPKAKAKAGGRRRR